MDQTKTRNCMCDTGSHLLNTDINDEVWYQITVFWSVIRSILNAFISMITASFRIHPITHQILTQWKTTWHNRNRDQGKPLTSRPTWSVPFKMDLSCQKVTHQLSASHAYLDFDNVSLYLNPNFYKSKLAIINIFYHISSYVETIGISVKTDHFSIPAWINAKWSASKIVQIAVATWLVRLHKISYPYIERCIFIQRWNLIGF